MVITASVCDVNEGNTSNSHSQQTPYVKSASENCALTSHSGSLMNIIHCLFFQMSLVIPAFLKLLLKVNDRHFTKMSPVKLFMNKSTF